jgi:hypothetical protein
MALGAAMGRPVLVGKDLPQDTMPFALALCQAARLPRCQGAQSTLAAKLACYDQPGQLQALRASKGRNAGPVNFIDLLAAGLPMVSDGEVTHLDELQNRRPHGPQSNRGDDDGPGSATN